MYGAVTGVTGVTGITGAHWHGELWPRGALRTGGVTGSNRVTPLFHMGVKMGVQGGVVCGYDLRRGITQLQ